LSFHLCQVQDEFAMELRHILIRTQPMRLTEAALNFLDGKGIHVYDEESTYIKLFIFEGNPILLPHFVCVGYFVVEVCKQYKSRSSFFDKKKKRQFILFPFLVVDISIKIISHLA
jgi:hypothetical protein